MPATPETELQLVEIFSSLQGEGVFIGCRQIFVRLAGCNLGCAYCDTDHARRPSWTAENIQTGHSLDRHPNPATPETLVRLLQQWHSRWPLHHSMALTGGEPLMQAPVLARCLGEISRFLPVFLETNGTLPDALDLVLPHIQWVSMDIKAIEVTGQPTPWDRHAEFLAIARGKTCQVKLVVDSATNEEQVLATARFVRQHAARVPLILQPRTVNDRPEMTGQQLLVLQAVAASAHPDTRVIPQVHPLLSIR